MVFVMLMTHVEVARSRKYANILIGGVSYILMFNALLRSSGFPWAIRGIGFVSLFAALLSFPALLSGSKVLTRPRRPRQLFDPTALRDRLFLIFTCSSFFTFLGYIVPYFYIPTYAKDKLGMSQSMALNMLVLAIAGSFFGRLAGGIGGHYFGSIFTWMVCACASGVLSLCWIGIEDDATFMAFSVLWGIYLLPFYILPSLSFISFFRFIASQYPP